MTFDNPIQQLPLDRHTFTIPAGGTVDVFPGAFRSFQIISITGGDLYSRFQDQDENLALVNSGFTLPDGEFIDKITFRNPGASGVVVVFVTSAYEIRYNVVTLDAGIQLAAPDTVSTPASTTATSPAAVLVSANANRRELVIQNHSLTENVWVGDSNVGNDAAPRGFKIGPDSGLTLTTSGELYCQRGDSTDVTVTVMELTD